MVRATLNKKELALKASKKAAEKRQQKLLEQENILKEIVEDDKRLSDNDSSHRHGDQDGQTSANDSTYPTILDKTRLDKNRTDKTRDSELLLFYNYKLENAKDKLKLKAWLDKQFKDKNTSVIKEFEDFKKSYRNEKEQETVESFDVENLHPKTIKLLEKIEITKLETTSSSLIVWERGGLKNEYSIEEIKKIDMRVRDEA